MILAFAEHHEDRLRRERARHWARAVGMLFLWTSGVHAGIVAAEPQFYRHFADGSFLAFVRDGWQQVVMAEPVLWGLLLMAGEATLGALLLVGRRWAKVGWVGVIAFHVLLMLFGFGIWLWAVPALAVLVPLAVRDWPGLGDRPGSSPGPPTGRQDRHPAVTGLVAQPSPRARSTFARRSSGLSLVAPSADSQS